VNKCGKILGVDFGRSKVGLAICNVEQNMVFRRGVIKRYKSLENLFDKLSDIIKKEDVVNVVFGLPLSEDGGKTDQSNRIVKIGEKLEAFLNVKMVKYQDESFSTFEAKSNLLGINGNVSGGEDDDMAAFIILRNYLQEHGNFKK
jgi:putative Holliday junction resolvase